MVATTLATSISKQQIFIKQIIRSGKNRSNLNREIDQFIRASRLDESTSPRSGSDSGSLLRQIELQAISFGLSASSVYTFYLISKNSDLGGFPFELHR